VEPLGFHENYSHLRAYEPAGKKIKVFKLERISEIILLDKPQKYKNILQNEIADVFGIIGNEPVEILLKLSMRAYLLLREEFPHSLPFLIEENQNYFFSGTVNGFQGVSRFILGLLDEVEVIRTESLREYLQQKICNRKICLAEEIFPHSKLP
jgi:predicted DNA-binding transcriptional regulator YafY